MSKKRKRKLRKGPIILLCVLILLAACACGGAWWYSSNLEPVGNSSDTIAIEVSEGEQQDELLSQLEQKGLIRNTLAAKIYLAMHKDLGRYAGTFVLSNDMSTPEVLAYLSNPDNMESSYAVVTIPEGYWAKQVAKELEEKIPGYTAQDYLDLWNSTDYINTLAQDYDFIDPSNLNNDAYFVKLEGYLFPETYYIDYNMTPDQITRVFLDQFQTIYDKYKDQIEASPYSLEQLLTLASIVQFESGSAADMPDIARVFYNRLDQGMKLQSSVTVCYALYDQFNDAQDCETNTDVDSPYNTYEHEGLPIGPILNPGEEALNAVLNPADNDYLYFVADIYGDGSVHYATTYEEHEANIEKYGLRIDN